MRVGRRQKIQCHGMGIRGEQTPGIFLIEEGLVSYTDSLGKTVLTHLTCF